METQKLFSTWHQAFYVNFLFIIHLLILVRTAKDEMQFYSSQSAYNFVSLIISPFSMNVWIQTDVPHDECNTKAWNSFILHCDSILDAKISR